MANEGLGLQTTVCTSEAEAYLYVEAQEIAEILLRLQLTCLRTS